MGRTVTIAILVVAVVCVLKFSFQHAATRSGNVSQVSAPAQSSAAISDSVSALAGEKQAVTEIAPTTASGEFAKDAPAPVSVSGHSELATSKDAGLENLNSAEQLRRLKVAVLAERIPAEATIISEVEEDGHVVRYAGDPDEFSRRLNDVLENRANTASTDLLRMYQAETDLGNKSGILSAATMFPYDQNTWLMLRAALSPSQPMEIRVQAAASAAERSPEQFLQYLADADPLVQREMETAFSEPVLPTVIFGAQTVQHILLPPPLPNKH